MEWKSMNLNIHYALPKEIWDKMPEIYAKMDGWLGFGKGGEEGQEEIPYWYSYDINEKHISTSIEPSGLAFGAKMEEEEWSEWCKKIKMIATETLGFKVGEIELGEVGYEIEWLDQ